MQQQCRFIYQHSYRTSNRDEHRQQLQSLSLYCCSNDTTELCFYSFVSARSCGFFSTYDGDDAFDGYCDRHGRTDSDDSYGFFDD